ncbi:hypothetical protein CROQUDRAFT_669505 [Cronartium quercuum f. sp. fusiforme G11]|uniref:rRNA-processing protein EFG1 n=1 Tax=Cronartium quercuum f. sp. fusiforme G11 TaxID=708437 RepID=A0A9P6TES1_9BASI|nr:hypothetical protein CROQUDRAFT_669505 [Cronartium quercuum f. sp. fusiforme G11]
MDFIQPSSSNQGAHLLSSQIGSNKLKSRLRQANRLLKKQGLSEKLKKATEAQIETLQAALRKKSSKEQERANAIRYHRVKFFDRKKINRRLQQVIRQLQDIAESGEDNTKDARKQKKRLDRELQQLRIDLHYVNAYPKHLKYVSLYPNGTYAIPQTLPPQLPSVIPSTKEPDALRNYVRAYISEAMQNGILNSQPELFKEPQLDEDGPPTDDEATLRRAHQKEDLAADDFFAS